MTLMVRRTGKADYSRYIKALIVGSPGAGKTLTSSTWKNPLIASAEGGLMSIADRNVPYIDIKTSESLLQLKILMDQDPDIREKYLGFPVDTLVIDTIDEVQKIFIRERIEENKKESMELRDWGWLAEQMRSVIRGFRNVDVNLVLTCHMKETSDSESGRLFFVPALQGAIGEEIPAFVDLSLWLKTSPTTVVENGENKRVMARYLQTYPDPQHPWIKDRSGKLPQEFEINFDDDYERLYQLIYGNLDELPETEVVSVGPIKARTEVENSDVEVSGHSDAGQATTSPKAKSTPVVQDAPSLICEGCGGKVESENQADISKIRFRKALCRTCFVDKKKK